MADLSTIRLYRLTHMEHIPHILKHGITHAASENANPNYQPIGDQSLIFTRGNKKVPIPGLLLGDFTPFYFAYYTPMLYVIQRGYNMVRKTSARDIVHCVTNVQRVVDAGLDFIFTNGHAVNGLTDFFPKEEINRVEELVDFQAVREKIGKMKRIPTSKDERKQNFCFWEIYLRHLFQAL